MDAKEAVEAKANEKVVRSASKKFYFPVSTAAEMKGKANAAEDCLAVHELNQKMEKDTDFQTENLSIDSFGQNVTITDLATCRRKDGNLEVNEIIDNSDRESEGEQLIANSQGMRNS